MIETNGWLTPDENWSKLPHQFFEFLPEFNTTSEAIVILYILRHTWGYQEYGEDDFKVITIDEFMHGRKRKDGTRIDRGTGLTRNTIKKALAAAELDNLICIRTDDRDKARIEKAYRLNMWGSKNDPPVSEIHPHKSKNDPRTEKDTSRKKEKTLSPNGNGEGEESLNTKYKNTLMVEGVGISLDNPEAKNHWWYISPIAAWLEGKDKPSHSRARDAELIPGCHEPPAVEELKAFLEFWRDKGLNMPESVGTFSKEFGKWRITSGFISRADPRASQQWLANAQIYRAYADAFSDRWSDAEILAQDFSGIEAWWYHTGQYEQGSEE